MVNKKYFYSALIKPEKIKYFYRHYKEKSCQYINMETSFCIYYIIYDPFFRRLVWESKRSASGFRCTPHASPKTCPDGTCNRFRGVGYGQVCPGMQGRRFLRLTSGWSVGRPVKGAEIEALTNNITTRREFVFNHCVCLWLNSCPTRRRECKKPKTTASTRRV